MQSRNLLSFLDRLKASSESFDRAITRRENVLSLLIARFVLMSGLVVGFSWWALNLSP